MPSLRRWYFCLNDNGIPHFDRCIRVAVGTARQHTKLEPICLYSGRDHPFVDEMQARGVTVIRHQSSLSEAIGVTEDANGWDKRIATGANLRLDIPLIEDRDAFVLYTDCDVMFLEHPKLDTVPEFFAAAPEGEADNWSFANTGVMTLNVAALREKHSAMIDFARPRLNTFGPLGKGTYDQGILNAYFAGRWDRLPLSMNWKPYWGTNHAASIVHFHGPKPQFVEAIVSANDEHVPQVYKDLYQRAPGAYGEYLSMFHRAEALTASGDDPGTR